MAHGRIRIKWVDLYRHMDQIRGSDFHKDLLSRAGETKGLMGDDDACALYAVVRHFKPKICLETGTGRGKAAAFILKGLYDNEPGSSKGRLISIERNFEHSVVGELIPKDLRDRFIQVKMTVQRWVKMPEFKDHKLDLFLHDSTHRYKHQLWEFKTFWPLLKSGGVLCSHDVDYNTSFTHFVADQYKSVNGLTDFENSGFAVWMKLSNFGFILKR